MRERMANWLVALARKIDPPNKAAMQFLLDRVIDYTLTGQSTIKVTRVSPEEMYADPLKTA